MKQRKFTFLDLSETEMLNSKAFQFLLSYFSCKYSNNIAICRAIGFATAIINYDPKKGYGFTPYTNLPQEGQISQLAADGVLLISLSWIKNQRCYRYEIDSITRNTFLDLLNEDGIILEQQVTSGEYTLIENPNHLPIRIALKSSQYNHDAEYWIKANRAKGLLTLAPCKTHYTFLPIYHTNKSTPGRLYELSSSSYQTLPSDIKFLLLMPDQQNMDIVGCHKEIAKSLDKEIGKLFDFKGAVKTGVLGILNGMGVNRAGIEMPDASTDDIKRLKIAAKQLAQKLGYSSNKLWQEFHRIEQEWIKTVTNYLDECEIGYLNMHDGLLVDRTVDYRCLKLQFGWIDKPLS